MVLVSHETLHFTCYNDDHILTDIVAQCHVAGDVNTGGLLVPGQQAPVSEVTQGGRHHASKQQHQHLHPRTTTVSNLTKGTVYKSCLFLLVVLICVRKYFLLLHIHLFLQSDNHLTQLINLSQGMSPWEAPW